MDRSILRRWFSIVWLMSGMGWLASPAGAAEERLPVALVNEQHLKGFPALSVAANLPQRKLYVGSLSRDERRLGLWVLDLGDDGRPTGEPRRYSDHPDELPAGHHSSVVCLLHDAAKRKLYLGVQGSHPTHARSLVMVALDAQGEPTGQPEAFDHGNPNKSCDALALHPRLNRLYAVGWGGEGVFVLDRDEAGRPRGLPAWQKFGSYGAQAIAIREDGTRLYRGTYPATLEVCPLDAEGNIAGPAVSTPIPDGPKEYLRFAPASMAIYFQAPDRRLAWFRLDAQGDVTGGLQTAAIPQLQAVAASDRPDRLLVAVASQFADAVTGAAINDGVQVRELPLDDQGAPGQAIRESAPWQRNAAVALAGGADAALAGKSLGRGFLGNRVAGLKVRARLDALEAEGTPLPHFLPVAFGAESTYLRFVVSQRRGRVYGVADGELCSLAITVSATAGDVARQASPDGVPFTGPVALDQKERVLYVGRKDGALAVCPLDEQGRPQPPRETLVTGASTIGAILVHPQLDRLYVVGDRAAPAPAKIAPQVTLVPVGPHAAGAVLDAAWGRIYAICAYRGTENTSLWRLDPAGDLVAEPTWLDDGIPGAKPGQRNVLSHVQLDRARRRWIVTGAAENATTPASIIVRALDEAGDPQGAPAVYTSANGRGSCLSLEATSDGQAFFESGWGEAKIFLRACDERWQPRGEPSVWQVGAQGKSQLQLVTVDRQRYLLAGTYPATLEILPLRTETEPQPAAQVEITCEGLRQPLGLLSAGQTTGWVDLDPALQNGVGRGVVRCALSGLQVRRAVVHWELARATGDEPPVTVREADVSLIGSVAALIVPKYGLDDPSQLAAQVRTSAEEFASYRDLARKHQVSPSERPARLLVANGLIGLDSSDEALEAGMETLRLLGHNTAQIWSWPGVAPAAIRAVAARHGIDRFREAVYNPPAYFHYQTELMQAELLDRWAAGFKEAAAKMGAQPNELELLHMGDEPGWYFPKVLEEVAQSPQSLEVFRAYLRDHGLQPADVGASRWEEVRPGTLSDATTLPKKRLFYWTARFYPESLSTAFAAATRAVERQVGPATLTTSNLNNWPGRFFIPSPGEKIANNSDAGPDAAMGMPDWFDLGRKRAIGCIWTEDWFGDADAQLWSLYGDLLRCAAREGGIEYGGYPVGQSTGAFPEGATLKIASLLGHGAKVIDPYIFGPNLAFADGWSEKEATYRNLGRALRLAGRADRLVHPGRPRDGSVAIVFPQASQVWDTGSRLPAYQQELYGLHAALIHESFPVDFVDDHALEQGALSKRRYATIYVTAPNLSRRAQQALLDWTEAGGALVLSPGACAADEYNEPLTLIRDHSGVEATAVARVAPPHHTQAYRIDRLQITVAEKAIGAESTFAISQTAPLRPTTGTVLATFAPGEAAVVRQGVGQGVVISLGFWPGVTYWLTPDRSDVERLPQGWSDEVRQVITWPARQAQAARPVTTDVPGVEACLLESASGQAVTLLNWTGRPIPRLTVTLSASDRFPRFSSVERGKLQPRRRKNEIQVSLPLDAVDVLLVE